jgi:hypothetical protein
MKAQAVAGSEINSKTYREILWQAGLPGVLCTSRSALEEFGAGGVRIETKSRTETYHILT